MTQSRDLTHTLETGFKPGMVAHGQWRLEYQKFKVFVSYIATGGQHRIHVILFSKKKKKEGGEGM